MASGAEQVTGVPRRRRDPRLAGVLVVAGTAVVVLPIVTGGTGGLVVGAAAVLAVLTAGAFALGVPAGIRALVFLDIVFAVFAAGYAGSWPQAVTTVLACVLPVAALLGCDRTARLRPAAGWLRPGHATADATALGLAAIVLGGIAVTVWAVAVDPAAPGYLARLQELPVGLAVAGVAGFALVNPIWEEALFRGVVLGELAAVWGTAPAVVVQALLFGVAHWAGFPAGWLGMSMAACWGLALGIIRARTGGILLPYAVHVGVNAVIGTLALVLL